MNYYIIAGEASGDLHAANLIKALRVEDPNADIRAWGGDLMEAAGATLVRHYRELAFMGFVEVVKNLRTILRNIKFCKADIDAYQPDVLILVDYPGFNLRIANWAKERGYKVFYYIAPQIWAWHSSRIHQIKKSVDRLYTILPFEGDFYHQFNYETEYHGHPLVDVFAQQEPKDDIRERHQLSELPIVALLPGSRKQEVERLLSVMLALVPRFADYQFVIAAAPALPIEAYQHIIADAGLANNDRCQIVQNETYDLLRVSQAALVTSGTATLETAILGIPQIVCYKTSPLTYFLAKNLVEIKYISLVNLIADQEVVPEMIQGKCEVNELEAFLNKLLSGHQRETMITAYEKLHTQLGETGVAKRIAKSMIERLN
ncbi:MAG: lipid-A-disaccharide synthase [Bacteroidota bacterium]